MNAHAIRRQLPLIVRVVATLLLLGTFGRRTTPDGVSAQVFSEVDRYGVVVAGNEANFSFAHEFAEPPIVVVSDQVGGAALLASTIHTHTGGFNIFVTDHQGNAVPESWVQWIAVEPDPARGVQASYELTAGGRVEFPEAFEETPIVVTNAWANDKPMASWATDIDETGFNLYALDASGVPIAGNFNAYWIAVVPSPENGFTGGSGTYNHFDSVSFAPAMERGPAYIVNAAGGLRAGAVDNRNDGFTLSLIDSTGQRTNYGDIQWLGYAGEPADGGGDQDGGGSGGARIVATSIFTGSGSLDPPASVCFDVSLDELGFEPVGGGCASGEPASAVLVGSEEPLVAGETYYVSQQAAAGWELASPDPVAVVIPAETGVEVVFFVNTPETGLFAIEQGRIVITAVYGGSAAPPSGERCYTVGSDPSDPGILARVCGGDEPLTLAVGPNNPDLETGFPYTVTQEPIPGWHVYRDNPVQTVILPSGAVGVSFISVPDAIQLETGTLRLLKTDESGGPLGGACWLVGTLPDGDQFGTEGDLCDADGDGVTELELPPGDYAVIETVAPEGYGVEHGQQAVQIAIGETVTLTIVNSALSGDEAERFLGGNFSATVLVGPSAGHELAGHLSAGVNAEGEITHGELTLVDGTVLAVTGTLSGHAIALAITLVDGRTLYVVGVAGQPLSTPAGDAGGTMSGPSSTDSGVWRWTDLQPEGSCDPIPCPV